MADKSETTPDIGEAWRQGYDAGNGPVRKPRMTRTSSKREYTREEMREACRNNYNAALLEARLAAIEMAKSEERSAATALRLFANTLYELAQR